jgi:hypothetical protein
MKRDQKGKRLNAHVPDDASARPPLVRECERGTYRVHRMHVSNPSNGHF